MAEKEKRILCIETYEKIAECGYGDFYNTITRQEAIERIATGFCGGICEKCTDGPKGSEHCIKWLEFRGTMEKAEAALNALVKEC